MAVKRIVSTSFWEDDKVLDLYSPEDKYFMLYLLTNPKTTQLGIYKLPKKIMSFETGYTGDSIKVLIERFETKYKNIRYDQDTQEIAILNSLKHSIIKGGKPVEDLLKKELSKIESYELIKLTYNNMMGWWNRSIRKFDVTVKELFEKELKKRNIIFNDNDNDNDNDNEDSYNDSYNDSFKSEIEEIEEKYNSLDFPKIQKLTTKRKDKVKSRLKEYDLEFILKTLDKANESDFLKGKNDRGWKANFDWFFVNEDNLLKVSENKYNPKKENNVPDWFNQNFEEKEYEYTDEERKQLERIIKGTRA